MPKLRLKYSRLLKPRFLYACAADGAGGLKILFFDLAWRGTDAAEFKPIGEFMSLEEMKLKIEQGRQKQREQTIILDNPDPANLIQRAIVSDGNVKIIDNIPVAKARELFEQGVKSTQDPLIAELKRKAWENKDYEPTEEELAAVKAWAASPDIILTEEQLQRIYEFPAGSVWDFFLAVLGVKKIPTTRERIEAGFDSYLKLYNFTAEQSDTLRKIKDAFVANLSSQGRVDIEAIFANPIYARLIGSFEEANQKFEGKLKQVVAEMQSAFKAAA